MLVAAEEEGEGRLILIPSLPVSVRAGGHGRKHASRWSCVVLSPWPGPRQTKEEGARKELVKTPDSRRSVAFC